MRATRARGSASGTSARRPERGRRAAPSNLPSLERRGGAGRSRPAARHEELPLIDHTGIGVADVGRAAVFYDAVLGALGLRRVAQMPEGLGTDGIGYGRDHPVFWIDRFHPHSVRQHTAFVARDAREVEAFHRAGLLAGGRDNGAPGARTGDYYTAFLLDSDGNNIEAVFRGGTPASSAGR
jgi:catechol 2,3-dioxygenase-like lactoylglutathione lyase family enzyme